MTHFLLYFSPNFDLQMRKQKGQLILTLGKKEIKKYPL